ncbi:MAG: hypothetical protein LUD72_06340, partial [Bacteroidales bacterium]|nr:hypothetical protein [Bacteroidales bacterium]
MTDEELIAEGYTMNNEGVWEKVMRHTDGSFEEIDICPACRGPISSYWKTISPTGEVRVTATCPHDCRYSLSVHDISSKKKPLMDDVIPANEREYTWRHNKKYPFLEDQKMKNAWRLACKLVRENHSIYAAESVAEEYGVDVDELIMN